MRLSKSLSVIPAVAMSLGGCASTITAFQNDPAEAHTLRPDRFFTLSGNSRLAFQVERYDPANPPAKFYDTKQKRWVGRMAWCAESLPEVAQAVSATSKPTAKLSDSVNLGTEDSFGTTLVQTFARTEIAEIYRQMSWQACQAWAQGVMTDDQYRIQLNELLKVGGEVIKTRATQPLTPPKIEASAAPKKDEAKPDEKKKDSASAS